MLSDIRTSFEPVTSLVCEPTASKRERVQIPYFTLASCMIFTNCLHNCLHIPNALVIMFTFHLKDHENVLIVQKRMKGSIE